MKYKVVQLEDKFESLVKKVFDIYGVLEFYRPVLGFFKKFLPRRWRNRLNSLRVFFFISEGYKTREDIQHAARTFVTLFPDTDFMYYVLDADVIIKKDTGESFVIGIFLPMEKSEDSNFRRQVYQALHRHFGSNYSII